MTDIAEVTLARAIEDARNRAGMQVGLPTVTLPLDHALRLQKLLKIAEAAAGSDTRHVNGCTRNPCICGEPGYTR